jgi:predicted secreted hydrolase
MKTVLLFLLLCLTARADEGEWVRAVAPRAWQFPRDHGAHPESQSEWWYFTGNLADAQGRPFGYQLTIFRQGITRHPAPGSAWAARDFYFAHFTISDLAAKKFHFAERLDRGALGQAGSRTDGMNAWLRDWKIETVAPETYRLTANDQGRAIDLVLHPLKPLVLEGAGGLSHKSAAPGNASNYYSYSRLATEGTLAVGGKDYRVIGLSWFDHEFSTSSLGEEEIGWDWFSLQFDSGDELMLYLLRNADGTIVAASSGTWIPKAAPKRDLRRADFTVEPLATWTSPATGGRYPARWKVTIPSVQATFTVAPRLADQELALHELGDLSYWEGACAAEGIAGDRPLRGTGYVELTGYAQPLTGRKP